ncbi:MAG: hypothetical protein ACOWYE_05710 [Desulfatiglandales bacterium]
MLSVKTVQALLLVTLIGATPLSAEQQSTDATIPAREALTEKGLTPRAIRLADFHEGVEPKDYRKRTGAAYKASWNEEPSIPAQCWIETGYGTQNACLFCHTDYLASIKHGNAFPLGEDQILYSFPSPDLNKVLWRNTIFPNEIGERLKKEGIAPPDREDVGYVRQDNWRPAYNEARSGGSGSWINTGAGAYILFPALNPAHLYPAVGDDPTSGGKHGFIDQEGFVRDERSQPTGWRAVNFFPYGIFTPMSGSVSGIYLRLPRRFMTSGGELCLETYRRNLDLLEKNIKNRKPEETHYFGDAAQVKVDRGFFPVGSEFAHPLHYVDLKADGEIGGKLDGVAGALVHDYEFPGTRSKRVKEIRYMYKWKDVALEDIDEDAHYEEFVIGHEGQGWVDNNAGWLLSAFIEDRRGRLRPQTTEELMQCIGCHGKVGNTVDSVWSFQRKLPGAAGWREMDYGAYDSKRPQLSRLQDYMYEDGGLGELGFFYHVVVGADLYGVMPGEIADELKFFARGQKAALDLKLDIHAVFSDGALQKMAMHERKAHLLERQKIMRAFVAGRQYLQLDRQSNELFVKGSLLYPTEETMKSNIELYRRIVLDQSYNLGKDVFGDEPGNVPFTFRSDGSSKDATGKLIPVGGIIASRPYNEKGEGINPTGIVGVNAYGRPVDAAGKEIDIEACPEKAAGHISTGGTFDTMYNPILSDTPLTP